MGAGDRWVWLGLLLIVVLSGLVAWAGDSIGRRIGRRRLTFWGLRPKNTAILFTVLTGMAIAFGATATLLLASEGARNRILSYTATVTALQSQAETQRRNAVQAQRDRQAALEEMRRAERDLATAESAVQRAAGRLRDEQTRLAAARHDLRTAAGQLAAARDGLQRANAARQAADRRRQAADRQRQAAEARVAELTRGVQRAQTDLRRAEAGVGSARQQLRLAEAELAAQKARAQTELRELESDALRVANQLNAQRLQAQRELEQAQADRDQLRSEANRLREEANRLQREAIRTLSGEIIVRANDELGRTRFREVLPDGRADQQMDSFLRHIDRRCRELRAGPASASDERAAVLYGVTDRGEIIEETQFLPFVLGFIEQARRAIWVRAIAIRNVVAGQPVPYTLRLDADRIVFSLGESIASASLDGALGEAEVARLLETLLREQVRPKAQERGLLANPDSRQAVVGPEIWLPALRAIKAAGRPVTVEVVAAEEIRTGDALSVEFRVLP
ncbi:MAG: DUF3084 domain-containing protein [Fimbriimonadaceae bacterium]|nr:DUF3084 domain-containing protein [Fimbriimonadaceae bacterium]